MLKRLLRGPAGQALLAASLGCYLEFALATTRWSLIGEENVAPFMRPGRPAVVALWHERLPLLLALWTLARRRPEGAGLRARALVSRHSDGRLLGMLMRRYGIEAAHGSSSRGGTGATKAMLEALQGGAHAFITPDGPRGPARRAALGVASLAALSGAPVLPVAAQTSRRHVLRTWDRMVLPLPLGRGRIVCLPPIHVRRDEAEAALPRIEAALSEAADIADRPGIG
jgi:lysophospholipid acyltransferase (LPLAT)-like uncharacterized protein